MTDRDLLRQKHRIEIEDALGRGNQGQVFRARRLARDGRTSMPCAVKFYPFGDAVVEPSKTMLEEIASMVRLCDSNSVVRLLDVIVETTFLALVLEECEQSFTDLLAQRQAERPGLGLPRAECYRLMEQIARGLGDCHADNVIHGDVKPHNMLLTRRGNAKLCDFGTARLCSSPTTLTSHGGTHVFMLPRHCELIDGRIILTRDRDVFGLALSYAYLRLGRHPFEHGHPASGRFDLTGLDDDEIDFLRPVLADEHIPTTDVCGWFRQLDPARNLKPTVTGNFDVSVKLLVDRVDSRRWRDSYQPDERDIEDIRHALHLLEEQDSSTTESADYHALRSRLLATLADLTAGSSKSKELFADAFEAINKAIVLAPDSAEHLAYRADLRQIKEYGGSRQLPLMFVLGPKPFDAPHAPNASFVDSWNPDSLAASLADITAAATLNPTPTILAKRALYLVLRGIKLYRDGDFPGTEDMDIWVKEYTNCSYEVIDWFIHREAMDDIFGEPIAELDRAISSSRDPLVTANLLLQRAWSHAGFFYGRLTEDDMGPCDPYRFPIRQHDYGEAPCVWSYGKAIADMEQALTLLSASSNREHSEEKYSADRLLCGQLDSILQRRRRAYSIRNGIWMEPFWFDLLVFFGAPGNDGDSERYLLKFLSSPFLDRSSIDFVGKQAAREFIQSGIRHFASQAIVQRYLNDVRSPRRST